MIWKSPTEMKEEGSELPKQAWALRVRCETYNRSSKWIHLQSVYLRRNSERIMPYNDHVRRLWCNRDPMAFRLGRNGRLFIIPSLTIIININLVRFFDHLAVVFHMQNAAKNGGFFPGEIGGGG